MAGLHHVARSLVIKSSTVRGGTAKPRQKSIPLGERMVYSRTFSRPGTSYGELQGRGLAPPLLPLVTRLCVYALALLWRINRLVTLIDEALRSHGSAGYGGLECGADGLVEAVR